MPSSLDSPCRTPRSRGRSMLLERTCHAGNRVRQSLTLGSVGEGARQRPRLPGPMRPRCAWTLWRDLQMTSSGGEPVRHPGQTARRGTVYPMLNRRHRIGQYGNRAFVACPDGGNRFGKGRLRLPMEQVQEDVMVVAIECVATTVSRTGEGAVWARDQTSFGGSTYPRIIHRFDVDADRNSGVKIREPVGCLAVRERGGPVIAAKSGFWFFDPTTGAREHIAGPEAHLPEDRFNDGTTDSRGRLWAATMKDGKSAEQRGAFHHLDGGLKATSFGGTGSIRPMAWPFPRTACGCAVRGGTGSGGIVRGPGSRRIPDRNRSRRGGAGSLQRHRCPGPPADDA